MNWPGLIVWSLVVALSSMAIAVAVELRARRYRRRARFLVRQLTTRVSHLESDLCHAEADRDHISAELDNAYRAAAATAWERQDATANLAHVRRVLTETRRILAHGDACAIESTADLARELVADRDATLTELHAVTADRDARVAEIAALTERQQAHLRMIAEVGTLRSRVTERDLAIDALTARVAELMPCSDRAAFVDGEIDAARAAAFRGHLRCCKSCQAMLLEDVRLEARLGDLRGGVSERTSTRAAEPEERQ